MKSDVIGCRSATRGLVNGRPRQSESLLHAVERVGRCWRADRSGRVTEICCPLLMEDAGCWILDGSDPCYDWTPMDADLGEISAAFDFMLLCLPWVGTLAAGLVIRVAAESAIAQIGADLGELKKKERVSTQNGFCPPWLPFGEDGAPIFGAPAVHRIGCT
ncbi:hypothetical protein ACLOJK_027127 [Asimina triloba]